MNRDEIIKKLDLTEKDVNQLDQVGISLSKVEEQVRQIKSGTEYVELIKSCTVDDGIFRVDKNSMDEFIKYYDRACNEKDVIKFVPASGAASRMFKKLESFMNQDIDLTLHEINNDEDYKYISRFFNNLKNFAFYDDLKSVIEKNGKQLDELLEKNELKEVLQFLLTEKGLDYSKRPKALIKFHKYDNSNKTPLEEQVKESFYYIKSNSNRSKLHFTIPPEFEEDFENEKENLAKKYSDTSELNIDYSFQKKSTNTIALDKNGNLFKEEDGTLLLRPGGHGALIENLNEIKSDVIFIKNIDNVQREEDLDELTINKKLLGGLLLNYQSKIFNYFNQLDENVEDTLLNEIIDFIRKDLGYNTFGQKQTDISIEKIKDFLNRPIRICGVVINEGHPGGGPFWIKNKNGEASKQIIEGNQVDKNNSEQKEIFNSSTHFNPVDIVCSVENYKGNKFDLTKYVDHSAVFVAAKSHNGSELKALELPGLWNGAMANWITVFVEVPKETFTPVKEVNDLLQDYHQ